MDQTVIATAEFLHNQIEIKDKRIAELEQHIQNVTQRSYNLSSNLNTIVDGMQAWTMSALEEREISETNAEEIAEICGFELTKEVEAEVSVTYYITVQVPAGENAEDIINDIDFDAITYDCDKVTNVISSVESIDV
jgi:hypothetical protein